MLDWLNINAWGSVYFDQIKASSEHFNSVMYQSKHWYVLSWVNPEKKKTPVATFTNMV